MSEFETHVVLESVAKKRCCAFLMSELCAGSACMAWRREWLPGEENNADYAYKSKGVRLEPKGGYCARVYQR